MLPVTLPSLVPFRVGERFLLETIHLYHQFDGHHTFDAGVYDATGVLLVSIGNRQADAPAGSFSMVVPETCLRPGLVYLATSSATTVGYALEGTVDEEVVILTKTLDYPVPIR